MSFHPVRGTNAMSLSVELRGDDGLPEGLATMSRETMAEHGVDSGAHVSVHAGTEVGVAQVLPDDVAGDAFRVDARLRRLLGVEPGDRVRLDPVEVESADRVTLALGEALETVDNLSLYFRERLIGQALVEGQRARIERDPDETTDGTHDVLVEVEATAPTERVVVRDWTTIRVRTDVGEISVADGAAGRLSSRVTRADVGGLDEELAAFEELVDLALHRPDRCERFGIDPPTGVLLHGPAGTGKTLMTRAVATHAEAHVERLSGPALASMRPEETAERLREAFAEATSSAPAMVVVDDIDALGGSDRVPDETIPQLLERMAALDRRSRTLVVATTTRLEEVDPALRRPGRLADEIEVGIPDRDGREEILERHARSLPLAADVDLAAYAERTHGFVGADLVSFVREGVLCALRRRGAVDALDGADEGADENESGRESESPEEGDTLVGDDPVLDLELDEDLDVTITPADLECAFRATEPSALRELLVEVPEVSWEDVGGLEEVKARLQESVQWPLAYADAFERVSLRPPTGVLLYGPSGTGKTLLAKAVANEADSNFVSVKGPELLDKYVGESEKGVREVFAKARENAPTVVFFDEIDAIAAERGGGSGDSGVGERIVSQLLTELDGLEDLTDVIVVATTNRPELIDDALLRPGRFDRHVHVGVPDEAGRREIFAVHTAGRPLAEDVDLDALAAETEGYVGADIEAACREAATAAVREYVAGGAEDLESMALTRESFERALEEVGPSGADGGRTGRFERFRERVQDG